MILDVWSYLLLERVRRKAAGRGGPCFADGLIGRDAEQGPEASCEVVDADEVGRTGAELRVAIVLVALDRRIFDRAVHSLDLLIRPGVPRLGQPVVDIVAGAG